MTEGWGFLVGRGWTVTPKGCWEYLGCIDSANGYGRITTRYGREGAHRISYRHHHGEIAKGLYVRHKCDNPPCVNPDHLEVGTPKQNMDDRDSRGHGPQGERNGISKLNRKAVEDINNRHCAGERTSSIAREYGVHYTTVRRVINGESWGSPS